MSPAHAFLSVLPVNQLPAKQHLYKMLFALVLQKKELIYTQLYAVMIIIMIGQMSLKKQEAMKHFLLKATVLIPQKPLIYN